ncbi:uncharacterized protein LOC131675860 [Topomyia yanbarensis]|uniref:uncharacterized protein LOC131675860 n=1 Tax=Topomyia yanbarensis TaxID=2498891 RepID=UPI00273A948D|nr:uncharacterized protein LOC131675860 [Topomyia yanbarensis]
MNSWNRPRPNPRLQRNVEVQEMGLTMRSNEVEVIISEFDPDSSRDQSSEEWLNEIDSMAEIFGWEPRRTMLYACMRLKGPAKFWYDGCKQELRTWEIFRERFLENFPTVIDTAGIHKKLINLKRKPDQSEESYFHETVALGRKIRLSDDLIKNYLIKGLPYASTRAVMAQDPAVTLPQFLNALIRVERATKEGEKRNVGPSGRVDLNRTPGRRSTECIPRLDATPRNMTPVRSVPNTGSFKSATPTPLSHKRQCFICRAEDHLARKCPQRKDFRSGVALNRTTIDRTLTERISKKLQLNIENDASILRGFAGGECKTICAVTETVQIDDFVNEIKILIVPNDAMKYDMLVGDDFFRKKRVSVVKTVDTITILSDDPVVMNVEVDTITTARAPLTIGDLNVEPFASPNSTSKLLDLLNRYRHCFAVDLSEIGCTDIETMNITLKEDKIVRHVPYRVAYGQRKYLQEEIRNLLKNDIIEESSSEFASPLVIVPKRTGDYRMCVDYRMLNAIVQKEYFPTNRVEEEIHNLSGKRVFTLLEMMNGYLQIGVDENSRKYTAFVTPDGQYQYKRVPFGLSNSVSVFGRVMSKISQPLRDKGISFYMDDVVISTETEEENLEVLELFLVEVSKSGMTLKVSKCEFFKRSIVYLGHGSAEGCVTPGETKTEAVEKFPIPTDAR